MKSLKTLSYIIGSYLVYAKGLKSGLAVVPANEAPKITLPKKIGAELKGNEAPTIF